MEQNELINTEEENKYTEIPQTNFKSLNKIFGKKNFLKKF